jgi:leader peptidase (prepilin peptidase) / N-methyltransferase
MNVLASEIPAWVVAVIAFLFGAAWGSFFNVAIYRWPLGLSVVRPPSHCPACHARIPAHLNVPILGYLILRGRSACCGQRLSPRYPVVETLGAVLCVAVAQRFVLGADPATPLLHAVLIALSYFAFAGGLLIATFVDLEHMEIPDEVSLPGAALGLATAVLRDPPGVESAALGAGAGFLVIQVLFVWLYEALFGRRGMGEGDSKLLLMIGAFIGWQGAAFSLFAGAAQGLVVAVIALLAGKRWRAPPPPQSSASEPQSPTDGDPPPAWAGHLKLPFGPFLALAALEYLFFGDALIEVWLRFMEGAP